MTETPTKPELVAEAETSVEVEVSAGAETPVEGEVSAEYEEAEEPVQVPATDCDPAVTEEA